MILASNCQLQLAAVRTAFPWRRRRSSLFLSRHFVPNNQCSLTLLLEHCSSLLTVAREDKPKNFAKSTILVASVPSFPKSSIAKHSQHFPKGCLHSRKYSTYVCTQKLDNVEVQMRYTCLTVLTLLPPLLGRRTGRARTRELHGMASS